MWITRKNLIKYEPKAQTPFELEEKAVAIYVYHDSKGNEYRRMFTAELGTPMEEFDNIAPKDLWEPDREEYHPIIANYIRRRMSS